ncbi:hypothetical protein D3C75_773690 [compost metagenome]
MVQAVFNRKDQFREHRCFTVFAQTRDAITQNRSLNQARFPTGPQTKTEGHERCLTVSGVQRIHFIFQRLESVITLFLGARKCIAFGIRDLPLFSSLAMFFKAFSDERCQHFINTVNRGAAVNVAGNLGNNLCRDGGRRRDGFRRFNLRITHLKTVRQHTFQINQHAVKHREEWRVIQIVIVNITALVRQHHITR